MPINSFFLIKIYVFCVLYNILRAIGGSKQNKQFFFKINFHPNEAIESPDGSGHDWNCCLMVETTREASYSPA